MVSSVTLPPPSLQVNAPVNISCTAGWFPNKNFGPDFAVLMLDFTAQTL